MRLESWKEEIIYNSMKVFMSVVDENLDFLRKKNFSSLRLLAEQRYFSSSSTEEEYKSKEPRLVKLTYNFLEQELNNSDWYCFDDSFYATLHHYGIKE